MTRPLWSVILAGGAGRRLFAVTNGIPKQFWRLEGQPSLLEETVARLAPLGALRTCLVVDRSHEPYLREARCGATIEAGCGSNVSTAGCRCF